MRNLLQDLRFGWRMLRKQPGFTLVAILTLALGIGANAAIFSIVNAVLLRPLPYAHPERLMSCYWQLGGEEIDAVTALVFDYWKNHSQSFDAAGYETVNSGFNLSGGAEAVRVRGLQVSEGFFRVLGASPASGRGFLPEEDRPKGPGAVIISDSLWRGYFSGDAALVGKVVQLNGRPYTVVGILPPDFRFEVPTDVLLPLRAQPVVKDDGQNIQMIVRLKPGVTLEQAQAENAQILAELRREFPEHLKASERGMRFSSYQESLVGGVSKLLWLLFGAVGLVLLIACANVANLMLARASARHGEIAVRLALGSSRGRLIRQLLTESWLLALAGSGAGLVLALWGLPALLAFAPEKLPRSQEIGLDYRVVLFAVLTSLATSLLFGVAPALRATRLDVNEALKAAAGKGGTGRLDTGMRSAVVVCQVALSLVLLVGAALLIKSFVKLHQVNLGFDPRNLTAAEVSLTSEKYRTTAQVWELERRMLERLSALPGVTSAAVASNVPLERGLRMGIAFEGLSGGQTIQIRAISPQYFRTLGMTLERGRTFDDADMSSPQPVAVVNETLARRYLATREPVGSQFRMQGKPREIIGVVSDIREMGLDKEIEPTIYVPVTQTPDGLTVMMNHWFQSAWIVRTSGPVDLTAALREKLREIDAQMPLASVRPMTQVIDESLAARQFILLLLSLFAALALMLTTIGIYGLLSYQVGQRTNEIGIRVALGAEARDILRMIIGQGLRLTLAGVGFGLLAAFGLTRLIAHLLFGVSATDPATFIAVSLLLALVAFLACYVPARRAAKVDPMVALRYE